MKLCPGCGKSTGAGCLKTSCPMIRHTGEIEHCENCDHDAETLIDLEDEDDVRVCPNCWTVRGPVRAFVIYEA